MNVNESEPKYIEYRKREDSLWRKRAITKHTELSIELPSWSCKVFNPDVPWLISDTREVHRLRLNGMLVYDVRYLGRPSYRESKNTGECFAT